MALLVPNLEAGPAFDGQSVPDSTDLAAQLSGHQNTGVLTGMAVTPSSGMTVAIAAGTFVINGAGFTYAGGTVTLSAASATDRKDILTISSAGTVSVQVGTPCGTAGWSRSTASPLTNPPPVKAAIPTNQVLLCEVYIANTTVTIATGNIIDKTVIATPYGGAWIAYTPIWTASTTNPTLGNGSISARYQYLGPKTVVLQFRLAPGNTTGLGSGNYSFSLPVSPSAAFFYHGAGLLASLGALPAVIQVASSATTFIMFWASSTSSSSLAQLASANIQSTGVYQGTVVYELA